MSKNQPRTSSGFTFRTFRHKKTQSWADIYFVSENQGRDKIELQFAVPNVQERTPLLEESRVRRVSKIAGWFRSSTEKISFFATAAPE
jgi:hypothetical protein